MLRPWRNADRNAYATLNADPVVMEHFPDLFTRAESNAAIERNMATIAGLGWGNWALERRADGSLLGHVGLKPTEAELPFGGTVRDRLATGAPRLGSRLRVRGVPGGPGLWI